MCLHAAPRVWILWWRCATSERLRSPDGCSVWRAVSWDNRSVRRVYIWFDLAIYLALYSYCLRERRPGWQYMVGMLVGAASFALWLAARLQIGNSFSARPRARALVTKGLYSKVRNPIYVFSTIGLIGICFAMHWYVFGLAYTAFVSLVQWRRAKAEAAVLEAAFGDEYRKYRAQTWF